MWDPAPPLALSPPERVILEAVVARQDIPAKVRKRGRVILMAADGVANHEIAREVSMARPRVLYWRQRFQQQGIRGLWDTEKTAPAEPVSKEVEEAILFDSLYRRNLGAWPPVDKKLSWTVRNVAKRHGVSPSSVQRIWKKHGIRMVRYHRIGLGVDVSQLKISQDPLFGITVYEIGGLFYETVGPALAFCSTTRPFSEFTFSNLRAEARKELVDHLMTAFRNLNPWNECPDPWNHMHDQRIFGGPTPAVEYFFEFVRRLLAKPRHADAEIHLILERENRGAYASEAAQAWLAAQPRVRLHYAPCLRMGSQWTELAAQWLSVISAWPMQASLGESAKQLSRLLNDLPQEKHLNTLALC